MPPSPSKPKSNFRQFNERAGRRGELLAALFLQAQAYLIVRRDDTIAIVEVKSRSFSHQEADALLAVNRRRIVRAAQFWLTGKSELADVTLRFDVIFLAPFAWPRHIVSAFDASGL